MGGRERRKGGGRGKRKQTFREEQYLRDKQEKKRSSRGNEERWRSALDRKQVTSFLLKMGKMSTAKLGNRN